MTRELSAILKELQTAFQALYGDHLVEMVLYGSQARGEAGQGSDIDLLVVLKGSVNAGEEIARTSQIVADVSLAHNEVVSCVFMDEDRFLHRSGPLLRNVRREGVKL